jgi:hypothetical protein
VAPPKKSPRPDEIARIRCGLEGCVWALARDEINNRGTYGTAVSTDNLKWLYEQFYNHCVSSHGITRDRDLENASFYVDLTDGRVVTVRLSTMPGKNTKNERIN